MSADGRERRLVVALFVSGFATFAQVFDAQAILPSLSRDLGIPSATAALAVSATTLGIAASVLAWAWLSDRIGRTAVMRISLVATTVLALLAPAAPTLEVLIGMRALTGVALGGIQAVAMALLVEVLPRHRVPPAAAMYIMGNTVGGVTGRVIAGPASELLHWRVGLLVVAAIGAVACLLFFVLLPRGLEDRAVRTAPFRIALAHVGHHLRRWTTLSVYLQGFLIMGSFTAIYNYLGFHLTREPFSLPVALASLFFLVYFVGAASARIAGGLAVRIPPWSVVTCGGLLVGVAALPMLAGQLWVLFAGVTLLTIGTFMSHPLSSTLSGMDADRGRAQSTALYQLSWLTGAALWGWFGGVLYDRFDWTGVVAMSTALALIAVAIAASRAWATRTGWTGEGRAA
ncbi:MFS transporter [Agrococcus sp. TF02-05]|uniref:MFS transporter n=1 Tax=Agrococcus sp. TF02-05 TaxID=2815211 RepID=UPI001AA1B9E6|nr:MFS transporter [Agrococcus sp. TF02-05]MBO1769264.1 MFS transporter [Agrococcus sp. TF02-05]